MTNEIWKEVHGSNGKYFVSNLGNIKSVIGKKKRTLILKQSKACQHGRYFVSVVSLNNRRKQCYIHRLVAQEFINNPDNHPFVNHKNHNTLDNRVENLEWVTPLQNIRHSINSGRFNFKLNQDPLKRNTIPILNTESGIFFYSIKEAAASHGIGYNLLKTKIHKGDKRFVSAL